MYLKFNFHLSFRLITAFVILEKLFSNWAVNVKRKKIFCEH